VAKRAERKIIVVVSGDARIEIKEANMAFEVRRVRRGGGRS